ncbi:MAG: ABC transporter, partial [Deltaproteobacteria bacterium]|nr:ABC transporter [Deltaproteobacteria bacterium]
MTTTAVELIDVNVSLRGKSVLEDINFEIFDKEFVAIIGPNGGGKTV